VAFVKKIYPWLLDTSTIKRYYEEILGEKEFEDKLWREYKIEEKKYKGRSIKGLSRNVARILYVLIRSKKPEIVLETGVASGISSSYILLALNKNRKGQLISIDQPSNWEDKEAGWLVPNNIRENWQKIIGTSKMRLPHLLYSLEHYDKKKIGIFLHDSDHTYGNMKWEFDMVWDNIEESGLLLSHDISWNNAFKDFCGEIKRKPIIYKNEFGIIKK